jgi:adenylate kinase
MRKYIILGVWGSGKGTQAALLKDAFDIVHISVGDIFRWNVQAHTKLGARVKRAVAAGQLVPDDVVADIVKRRLEEHDWNFGFVLDGFPRNRAQAEFFLENYAIDRVILLEVPDEAVLERVESRRLCSWCGLDYNLIQHRPADPEKCDVCQGPLVNGATVSSNDVRRRLAEYHEITEPLVELFREKDLAVEIDGTQSREEVHVAIRHALGLPPISQTG